MHKISLIKLKNTLKININPPIKFDPYSDLMFIAPINYKYITYTKIELYNDDQDNNDSEKILFTLYPKNMVLTFESLKSSELDHYINCFKIYIINLVGKSNVRFI